MSHLHQYFIGVVLYLNYYHRVITSSINQWTLPHNGGNTVGNDLYQYARVVSISKNTLVGKIYFCAMTTVFPTGVICNGMSDIRSL